jgi:hypothetical protein
MTFSGYWCAEEAESRLGAGGHGTVTALDQSPVDWATRAGIDYCSWRGQGAALDGPDRGRDIESVANAAAEVIMKNVASILLLIAMCALGLKLAGGPLYVRYTTAECSSAYARARTHGDSARINLHPYRKAGSAIKHYCSEVIAPRLGNGVDIPGINRF